MALRIAAWMAASMLALLAGCATAPRHPALQQAEARGTLPPLLPVRRFVADVDPAGGYVLSPDGQSLLWSQVVGTDSGLAVRPVAGGAARTFPTGFLARPAGPTYAWLPDSRHVAFLKDLKGDENTQLHVFDSRGDFAPWAVTPWPGVRSYFVAAGPDGSTTFLFASNRRDKSTMDLYEADAASRTIREVARSDGHVLHWQVGQDRKLAARVRQLQPHDGADQAVEVLEPDGRWRALRTVTGWDALWLQHADAAKHKLWAFSNVGRDRMALVEIDTATGSERVLADHPVVDLGWAFFPRSHGEPVATIADDGLPTIRWHDAALGADVDRATARALQLGLLDAAPRFVRPQSSSEDGQRWVLRALGDFDDAELLLDRTSGEVRRLDPKQPRRSAELSPEEPYAFTTSDGRKVHGYLIRPRGVTGPAPLVVNIHGGPWARNRWSPAGYDVDQLLANRGYLVLTVNYRSSTGYGRDFMLAGRMQTFDRVQQDIAEAAQWAVDQGLADARHMAVLGASFGGFSVMAQLIRQDQDWRCGVNMVGVADWVRVMENWPPFWRNRHWFEAFYGNPRDPVQREQAMQQSPITHIARIKAPMLVIHGANDIRVLKQDSEDVVAALRQLGRPVQYLSFANEGHSVRRWRNRLEMWRRIEDHLASCLGGRSSGWDFYELMPR